MWFVVGIIVVVVGIIVVVVVVVVILVAVVHAKVVRNQFGLHDGSLQVFYGERGLGMAARGGVLILRDGGRDEEGGSGVGMGNKVLRGEAGRGRAGKRIVSILIRSPIVQFALLSS